MRRRYLNEEDRTLASQESAIADMIYALSHIRDIEGGHIPAYCFLHEITDTFSISDEEAIKIARDNGYKIVEVLPNEGIDGTLIIATQECSPEMIQDDYGRFYEVDVEVREVPSRENESLTESILVEDIESMKKMYPNIDDKDFMRYINLDPTYKKGSDNPGTYARWIMDLVKRGNMNNEGHIKDILTRFEDNKKNLINKDIMKYKTIDELEIALDSEDSYKEKSHRQEVRDNQKARKNADLNNEAELVYEDNDWEVWIPKTYAASCKLGQGTSWCTASTEKDYYYNHYKNKYGGEYYININKHNPNEKYQFHFESNQFMDENDLSIDMNEFLEENEGLKEFYVPIIEEQTRQYVEELGVDLDSETTTVVLDNDDLKDALSNSAKIDPDFVKAVLSDEPYDVYYYNSWFDASSVYNKLETSTLNVINKYLKAQGYEEGEDYEPIEDSYSLNDALDLDGDLNNSIINAWAETYGQGIINEFNAYVINAIERSVSILSPEVYQDYIDGESCFVVSFPTEKLMKHLQYIKEVAEDNYLSNMNEIICFMIQDERVFRQPYMGWGEDFDDDMFNDCIINDLQFSTNESLHESKNNIKVGDEITYDQAKNFYNRGYIDIVVSNDKGESQVINAWHKEEKQREINRETNKDKITIQGSKVDIPSFEDVVDNIKKTLGNDIKFFTKSPETNKTYYNEISDEGQEPQITGVGYKLFKLIKGKLYPPMVKNPGNNDTPIGKWIKCGASEFDEISSSWGKPQAKNTALAYRPGWHLGELPYAPQFEQKKNPGYMSDPKFVWGECLYNATIDYQDRAMSYGYTKDGKFTNSAAGLPYKPDNGAYKYRTNPNPNTIPWIITGEMKVVRILDDKEVEKICQENGVPFLKRPGGDKTAQELGLQESFTLKESVEPLTDERILNYIDECIIKVESISLHWGVEISSLKVMQSDSTTRFGSMTLLDRDGHQVLTLSKHLFNESEETIKNTIYHELCHYVNNQLALNDGSFIFKGKDLYVTSDMASYYSSHGKSWKHIASEVGKITGQDITRTDSYETHGEVGKAFQDKVKYIVKCTNCGSEIPYTKKTEFVKNPNVEGSLGRGYKWACGKCHQSGKWEVIEVK